MISIELQRYGLLLAASGLALGGLFSFWLRRAIEGYLYRVPAGDWTVWLSVCGVILLGAACASAIPARRAGRLDPMRVLRLD
jgi:ABC-type lipoprotein release transport system permease subunit